MGERNHQEPVPWQERVRLFIIYTATKRWYLIPVYLILLGAVESGLLRLLIWASDSGWGKVAVSWAKTVWQLGSGFMFLGLLSFLALALIGLLVSMFKDIAALER